MPHLVAPLCLVFVGACSAKAPPPSAPTLAPPTPAASETTESDQEVPVVANDPEPPADMPRWCKAACERNGETCEEIDVAGCVDNCVIAFGGVVDFCPIRLANFTACVDASPTRCKPGAKLRPEGCKDESFEVSMCIMLKTVKPEERCLGPCEDQGQCSIVDGACTATPEDCEKRDECKGGKCDIVDNRCTPR